jgi:hypothetical protein
MFKEIASIWNSKPVVVAFAIWTGWYLFTVFDGNAKGQLGWIILGFLLALFL